MAFDKDAFLAALDTMTVLELNDLVKAVENEVRRVRCCGRRGWWRCRWRRCCSGR